MSLLTEPAPRAARPPVQRTVEVVGRRPVDAYVELTLAAPDIADLVREKNRLESAPQSASVRRLLQECYER